MERVFQYVFLAWGTGEVLMVIVRRARGALIAFVGFGLAFGDWLALAALLVPVIAAIMYRVRVEEKALVNALGANYAEYSARTKRLIPGIY